MRTSVSAMPYIASLPITFLTWWFLESPRLVFNILKFVLLFIIHQLGYRSLFKTFFKPWKNEYREGLVGFSVIMGVAIKSLLIVVNTVIIAGLFIVELFILVTWVLLPFIILWGIYVGLFT